MGRFEQRITALRRLLFANIDIAQHHGVYQPSVQLRSTHTQSDWVSTAQKHVGEAMHSASLRWGPSIKAVPSGVADTAKARVRGPVRAVTDLQAGHRRGTHRNGPVSASQSFAQQRVPASFRATSPQTPGSPGQGSPPQHASSIPWYLGHGTSTHTSAEGPGEASKGRSRHSRGMVDQPAGNFSRAVGQAGRSGSRSGNLASQLVLEPYQVARPKGRSLQAGSEPALKHSVISSVPRSLLASPPVCRTAAEHAPAAKDILCEWHRLLSEGRSDTTHGSLSPRGAYQPRYIDHEPRAAKENGKQEAIRLQYLHDAEFNLKAPHKAAFRAMVAALQAAQSVEASRSTAERAMELGVWADGAEHRMLCDLMLGLQDNQFAVEGLRQALKARGLVTDTFILNVLVRIAGEARSKEQVLSSWEDVLKGGEVDTLSFMTLFLALGKCGQWELALHGLHLAHSLGIKLNTATYNRLLTCMEECNRVDEFDTVMHDMRAHGLPISNHAWSTLIKRLDKQRRHVDIDAVHKWMLSEGQLPSQTVQKILLVAKAHLGLWREVDSIMAALRAENEKSLSQSSMTRLIRMASNAKRPDTANQAFSWLKESKAQQLNTMHFGALIDGYAKSGDIREALRLVSELLEAGFKLHIVHCEPIITYYKANDQLDRVPEILDLMKIHGVPFTTYIHNVLISWRGAEKGVAAAEACYREAGAAGMLDGISVSSMLAIYEANGMPDAALSLYRSVKKDGQITLTDNSYRQIVGCLMKVGRVDETTMIFMEGLDSGAFHSFRKDLAHPLANELDLHELNAHSADAALLVWLRYLKYNMEQTGSRQPFGPHCPHAVIVTGQGNHSIDGHAVIRPRVRDLLNGGIGAPLPYSEPMYNPGCFHIRVEDLANWLLAGNCKWAL